MRLDSLPLDLIDPPARQHRLDYDETAMAELCESIATIGLITPIEVRPRGERYETIAGDRRRRAHIRLGRERIPAFIRDEDSEPVSEARRWAENYHRSPLTPMEEALAIQRAREELHLDIGEIARLMSRSRDWITARLELLTLSPELQDALHRRAISTGAAALLNRVDDADHRGYLLDYAERNGATITVLRAWVNEYEAHKMGGMQGAAPLPPMDQPQATPIVLLECYACGATTPHTEMVIARVCAACDKSIKEG